MQEIVRYWNKLVLMNDMNPFNKRMPKSRGGEVLTRICRFLMTGNFFRYCDIKPEVKSRIQRCCHLKKWTVMDIQKQLTVMSKYWEASHWPSNKDYLPKSLSDAFYSPFSRNSWFFMSLVRPPELLREARIEYIADAAEQYRNLLEGHLGREWKQLTQREKVLISSYGSKLKKLHRAYTRVIKQSDSPFKDRIIHDIGYDWKMMYRKLFEWYYTEYPDLEFSLHFLNPEGKIVTNFFTDRLPQWVGKDAEKKDGRQYS